MKTYSTQLEVRGYELDSFGHVNHAVYVSYLEHARWHMLYEEEITLEKFKEWKRWPVIAGIEIAYLKPTFLGDQLTIETHCAEKSRTSLSFEQTIKRGDAQVLRAKIKVVIVNENGKPSEMPEPMSKAWT
jgi:acyl-CoA thioester hydrolase